MKASDSFYFITPGFIGLAMLRSPRKGQNEQQFKNKQLDDSRGRKKRICVCIFFVQVALKNYDRKINLRKTLIIVVRKFQTGK